MALFDLRVVQSFARSGVHYVGEGVLLIRPRKSDFEHAAPSLSLVCSLIFHLAIRRFESYCSMRP